MKKRDNILHPTFLSGLIILILNDTFLKWHYSNIVTGKLSDFAGLFILPIFLAVVVPKSKKYVSLIVGVLFILWKSPMSTPLIDLINSLTFVQFNRVIDYSDLIALLILPFSHILIHQSTNNSSYLPLVKRQLKVVILVVSCLSFMSTSISRFQVPEGTIYIGKSHSVKMSKDSLLNRLNILGYDWESKTDTISSSYGHRYYHYYQVNNVFIKHEETIIDTLKNLKFQLIELNKNKTKFELINVELQEPGNIQNWKFLKRMSKYYRKRIKKGLLKDIQNQ